MATGAENREKHAPLASRLTSLVTFGEYVRRCHMAARNRAAEKIQCGEPRSDIEACPRIRCSTGKLRISGLLSGKNDTHGSVCRIFSTRARHEVRTYLNQFREE